MQCSISKVNERTDEECELTKLGRIHGTKLGAGEQGIAYEYDETKVVKVTKFNENMTEQMWTNEACIGLVLGRRYK